MLWLFILLFWGNSNVYAQVQYELNTNSFQGNYQLSFNSNTVAADNTDLSAFNLSQRNIKKEKAIIEDNDDEDEDDDDKSVATKKHSLADKGFGIFCYSNISNAHGVGHAKRCYPYSQHLAITSSCRLFIRNRVIRV